MIYRTLILFSVVSAFSMQVCMDTPDWLKGLVHEESGTGSSSSSAELFACPRPPVLERRLRPQHDQALKCPRCDSTHTKFCYYNNYSLSQPRYFCKTCRRYWTKGGSLRNVPVGGGCRKNKRSGKKPAEQILGQPQVVSAFHDGTDLHLSFAAVQPPHLDSLAETPRNFNFMACKYNLMLNAPTSNGELMEGKLGAMIGSTGSGSHMFMDGCEVGLGDVNHGLMPASCNGVNPYGFSVDPGHASFMEACQRLALPFEGQEDPSAVDVKPGNRMLSLEWPEQGCGEVGRDSFGYSNGLGLWAGMINGHGPSTAI